MKKLLLRISCTTSGVCITLGGLGVYLQSQKDLMIEDPCKFDAMMSAIHTGSCIKTIAVWVAIAAVICWIIFGIACIASRRNTRHS